MSTTAIQDEAIAEPSVDEGPVFQRRSMPADSEIDMTPMIDCVFLLNIFFILTFNATHAKDLAPAVTGTALDPRTMVIVTMAEGPDGSPLIYTSEAKQGSPLPADEASQREILLRYLQEGYAAGKTIFAIQAERGIKEGDVDRVANLVTEVEGMTLAFPVQEMSE